jgi:hypothetical protein
VKGAMNAIRRVKVDKRYRNMNYNVSFLNIFNEIKPIQEASQAGLKGKCSFSHFPENFHKISSVKQRDHFVEVFG